MKQRLSHRALIVIATLIVIAMLGLVIHDFLPEINLLLHSNDVNRQELVDLIQQHGIRDMIFLYIMIAVMNAIPGMSNSIVCIFAGLCYGPLWGLTINWFGNMTGNWLVAALIGHIDFSEKFMHNRWLERLQSSDHPWITLTVAYMIPVIPSVLVNYSCVNMQIPRRNFLVMVSLGVLPVSLIYAFGGDAIFNGGFKRLIIYAIIIIVLIMLSRLIGKNVKKRHAQ